MSKIFLSLLLASLISVCSADQQIYQKNLNYDLTRISQPLLDFSGILADGEGRVCDKSAHGYSFNHSVASGDPTQHSFIAWTRLSPMDISTSPNDLTNNNQNYDLVYLLLEVSESPNFDNKNSDQGQVLLRFWTTTSAVIDYTVKVDVSSPKLQAGKHYYYRFLTDNSAVSPIGRTKLLPSSKSTDDLKLAVYSCSNYAGGYYHAYKNPVLKNSVDYIIHLGDYLYEHENGVYTNGTSLGRTHYPNKKLWQLQDYRHRYAQYRSDLDLQLSHSSLPWFLVWDDHEISDNSWLRGSVDSLGLEFENRRIGALRAYMEWMPIRPPPDFDLYTNRKIWRNVDLGLADLLLLDTRHYSRDVTDIYSNRDYIDGIKDLEERTIMGFDQEAWLIDSLQQQKHQKGQNVTKWKLVGSQLVIQPLNFTVLKGEIGEPFNTFNLDGFDGYPGTRTRLLAAIDSRQIDNVVFLAGDVHVSTVGEIGRIVEFGGTAVSSPTIYPQHYSIEQCLAISEKLVESNEHMIWNEGYWRGYMELEISNDALTTTYYGVDVKSLDSDEEVLARFHVAKDSNKIETLQVQYGATAGSLSI